MDLEWLTNLVLKFFGIEDLAGLGEFLVHELNLKSVLDKIGRAVDEGDWKKAAELLGELLEKVGKAFKDARFLNKLEQKFGSKALKALGTGLKKLVGRFIPFIGWILLVAAVLDAVDYANQKKEVRGYR